MRWFLFPIWWLAVLGILVGYQAYLVISPGPDGVRFVSMEVQLLLLALLLSVPLSAGLSVARWRRSRVEEEPDLGGRTGRSALAGAIALPALALGFVVLDLLIESILGDPPMNWSDPRHFPNSFFYPVPYAFLLLYVEYFLASIVAGGLMGWLGGRVGGRRFASPATARGSGGVRRHA